jgi:hypothetical protein
VMVMVAWVQQFVDDVHRTISRDNVRVGDIFTIHQNACSEHLGVIVPGNRQRDSVLRDVDVEDVFREQGVYSVVEGVDDVRMRGVTRRAVRHMRMFRVVVRGRAMRGFRAMVRGRAMRGLRAMVRGRAMRRLRVLAVRGRTVWFMMVVLILGMVVRMRGVVGEGRAMVAVSGRVMGLRMLVPIAM